MPLLNRFLFATAALMILAASFAFMPSGMGFVEKEKARTVKELTAIHQSIIALQKATHTRSKTEAVKAFHQGRRHFKSAEYLLEYFHHSAIKIHLNGAPLPQIEKKVADLHVFEPQGFQRMEELLYEEEPNWAALSQLCDGFLVHLDPLITHHKHLVLYDRQVLEAVRLELTRIFTLGVTGFENPASDSTLAECIVAFSALQAPMLHYASELSDAQEQVTHARFEKGLAMLHGSSFEDFDRLAFFRTVIDPLFKDVLVIHTGLGIETLEEVNPKSPIGYRDVTSLFDLDLLNTDWYLKYNAAAITEKQRLLGKTLFFDPALSFNNQLACASCHQPDKAFTDAQPKSISNDSKSTVDRNAPTLLNAVFATAYFHDMRADRLERQSEHVMVSDKEFNMKTLELAEKLKQSTEYVQRFQEAFPGKSDPLMPHTIQTALAVYVSSLASWNSPFDQYARGEREELSASAKHGFNLFMGKAACGTCHFPPTFAGLVPPFFDDSESEVLGVTATNDTLHPTLDEDMGRFQNGIRKEHVDFYQHAFKTPTLRNIELTGPYFHNGAYPTLKEVMWFYNKGGGQGIGLDVPNQTLPPDALALTEQEIEDIIAFMNSLTDIEGFTDQPTRLPDFDAISELQNRRPISY